MGNHSTSILQGKNKVCYVTGAENVPLHKHHIYFGSNRAISDKCGFWVWIIPELHNMSNEGIHRGNKELDLKLKRECQSEFEKTHSRKEFMNLIGRNYL